MGCVDVNISSRGRDANIQRRLCSWRDGRYAGNPDNVSGNGDTIRDPDCDGIPVSNLELSLDPLGQHHRSRNLLSHQPHRATDIPLSV